MPNGTPLTFWCAYPHRHNFCDLARWTGRRYQEKHPEEEFRKSFNFKFVHGEQVTSDEVELHGFQQKTLTALLIRDEDEWEELGGRFISSAWRFRFLLPDVLKDRRGSSAVFWVLECEGADCKVLSRAAQQGTAR